MLDSVQWTHFLQVCFRLCLILILGARTVRNQKKKWICKKKRFDSILVQTHRALITIPLCIFQWNILNVGSNTEICVCAVHCTETDYDFIFIAKHNSIPRLWYLCIKICEYCNYFALILARFSLKLIYSKVIWKEFLGRVQAYVNKSEIYWLLNCKKMKFRY